MKKKYSVCLRDIGVLMILYGLFGAIFQLTDLGYLAFLETVVNPLMFFTSNIAFFYGVAFWVFPIAMVVVGVEFTIMGHKLKL